RRSRRRCSSRARRRRRCSADRRSRQPNGSVARATRRRLASAGRRRFFRTMHWELPGRTVSLDRPFVLGVVNVTPDSFSDGGRLTDADAAVQFAERLLETGADGVDVGGESTRPQNAGSVPVDEELHRVLPVIGALRLARPDALISVDTTKAEVARAALEVGADVVNDVSAFRLDAEMASTCAAFRAGVILMHSRGAVADMATFAHAEYGGDPVGDVVRELSERLAAARAAGVADER